MDVTDLLARAVEAGASDLHLAAGQIPMLRLDGELQRMNLPPLVAADLAEGMAPLLAEQQRRQWRVMNWTWRWRCPRSVVFG